MGFIDYVAEYFRGPAGEPGVEGPQGPAGPGAFVEEHSFGFIPLDDPATARVIFPSRGVGYYPLWVGELERVGGTLPETFPADPSTGMTTDTVLMRVEPSTEYGSGLAYPDALFITVSTEWGSPIPSGYVDVTLNVIWVPVESV